MPGVAVHSTDPRERLPRSPLQVIPPRWTRAELTLVGLVVLAALALRLPYLWQVPRFTDELQEILWALAIYRGEILPLTAVDSYYGPLWSYLLAGAFFLERLGADVELMPRLMATLLAVAGVGVTYALAREIASRRVALVAAALMATSGGHIIINSHTARSNSVTPLITTLLVWSLMRAVRDGNGRWLVAAGALFGVALQTHLSVITFVPGLALGLLALRPRLVLSWWTPAGVLAFVAAYANMLIFNLQTGFWSLVHARALQQGYTSGRSTDLSAYLTNVDALVESLSRLVSGTIDEAGNPAAPLYLLIGVVGVVLLARRGAWLPLLFCLSGALVLPYFNPRYGPILSGRYLIPLLPFLYIGVALCTEAVAERLPRLSAAQRMLASRVVAAALVLFPLAPLVLYYREVLGDDRTNEPLYHLNQLLEAEYQPGDLVLVDESLAQEPLTAGGTDLKAIRMLLEADGIPYQVAKLAGANPDRLPLGERRILTVMAAKKVDTIEKHADVVALGPEVESASGSGREYGVYRIEPEEARRPAFAGVPEPGP
ncbi:MAG: glycosyltransferase family 39 protein [Chloroflexi bacterium]|nr:glycosyltransferase family 39 protein [Chloroflexota bacterium]